MKGIFAGLIMLMVLPGCTNAIWVKEKKENKYKQIGGIPFYVKKEVFTQSTSYSQTWLEVELTVDTALITRADGKFESFNLGSEGYTKNVAKSQLSALNSLKESILTVGHPGLEEVEKITAAFAVLESLSSTNDLPINQIGNTVSSSWVVDEDREYYLNAPLPWFGTGSLTHELNADGTLSKVSSNSDTKLAESVSSLIPLKEFLAAKHIDSPENMSSSDLASTFSLSSTEGRLGREIDLSQLQQGAELVYSVSLNIEEVGYIFTFTRQYDESREVVAPIPFDIQGASYNRVALGGGQGKQDNEEESGKSIELSGALRFPENW